MTKEIIIDGVNVSECKYSYLLLRSNEHGCYAESERAVKITLCKNCPNCYFKQRKRAERKLKTIESVATDLLSLTNEYDNCYHKDRCNKCDKVCQYRFVDKILQIIEGEENGK